MAVAIVHLGLLAALLGVAIQKATPNFVVLSHVIVAILLVASIRLHHLNHLKSRRYSFVLCVAYILLLVLYGLDLQILLVADSVLGLTHYLEMAFLGLTLVLFLLENYSVKVVDTREGRTVDGFESPEFSSSFFANVTFSWMFRLIAFIRKNPTITPDDIYTIPHHMTAAESLARLEKRWTMELQKPKPSLLAAILVAYLPFFAITTGLTALSNALQLLYPLVTGFILNFVEAKETLVEIPVSSGLFVAGSFLCITLLKSLLVGQIYHYGFMVQLVSGQAVRKLVYKKSFRLSGKDKATTGHVVSLISQDRSNLGQLLTWAVPTLGSIVPAMVALYMLYQQVGWYFVIIPAVAALSGPIVQFLANAAKRLNKEKLGNMDDRVSLLTDILSGMKTFKMYGWSEMMKSKVISIRETEMQRLKSTMLLESLQTSLSSFGNTLATFLLFLGLTIGSKGSSLGITKVIQTLQLIQIVQEPISAFINSYAIIISAMASVDRLEEYLNKPERKDYVKKGFSIESISASIQDGDFSYGDDTVLKNINFSVTRGSVTAVVGRVGCGKSSLLNALLGEMVQVGGNVHCNGSVAYTAQQPWILNMSLRDNILFGKEFDEKEYTRVVDACALRPDLASFQNGDSTLIGPKGINLSGGQKARVALARALYAKSDILLLDDPLSAVDAHVDRHLFQALFDKTKGLLKNTTVILVTNAIHHLAEVDQILYMHEGSIVEQGSYAQLLEQKGLVCDLVREYMSKRQDSSETLLPTEPAKPSESLGRLMATNPSTAKAESRQSGSVSFQIYLHYIRQLGVASFLFLLLLVLIQVSMSNGSYYILSAWGSGSSDSAWLYFGIYTAFTVAYVLTDFSSQVFLNCYLGIRAANAIFASLLDKIFKLPMSFFDVTPVGQILQRVNSDQGIIDSNITSNLLPMVVMLLNGTVICITMIVSSNWMIVVLLTVFGLFWLLQSWFLPASRETSRLFRLLAAPVNTHITESLDGMQTLRAFAKEEHFMQTGDHYADESTRGFYAFISTNRVMAVMSLLLSALIEGSIPILAVLSPKSSSILVGVALLNGGQLVGILASILRVYGFVETDMISVERIIEYENLQEEAPQHTSFQAPDNWPSNGSIEMTDYATTYSADLKNVLDGISVNIRAGEKIGIVGRTGAGKSSLTLAFFRIIEGNRGSIVIDGIDISKLGLLNLRQSLTILPQDPLVFEGTLRSNLDPAQQFTDQEIWDALEAAHISDFVKSQELQLEMRLSSSGSLSVGQTQLVCLARAMLRRTKILILDEATSSIDQTTDEFVQASIRRDFKDATVLTIAHRIASILDYDRILVLDQGKVAEFASPQELLQNPDSIFYSLAKQSGLVQ
ncbi:hypothetical protein HDV03_004469 [Kappamyces sp. JEL0829]|nr:hypothetical protein HDV03_004469 [Kappamyces sp. JEL0829]